MLHETFKKTILIDLDGVLNTYTGNFCKDSIPDINVGAINFEGNYADLIEKIEKFKPWYK